MYQSTKALSIPRFQGYAELSDAHCHLNLFKNPGEVVKNSVRNGLKLIIAAGGSAKDNAQIDALASGETVFAVVGIGPDFSQSDAKHIEKVPKIIKGNRNVVGIGEIGLDYKVAKGEKEISLQKQVFAKQLGMAKEMDMPVVIHARNALGDVIKMLDEHSIRRALFHFFEGGADEAGVVQEKGYLISVPPVETGKRRKAVDAVDLSHIVVETDSPIVGETPVDVKRSLEMVSRVKKIDVNEVAEKTTANLREFFYI